MPEGVPSAGLRTGLGEGQGRDLAKGTRALLHTSLPCSPAPIILPQKLLPQELPFRLSLAAFHLFTLGAQSPDQLALDILFQVFRRPPGADPTRVNVTNPVSPFCSKSLRLYQEKGLGQAPEVLGSLCDLGQAPFLLQAPFTPMYRSKRVTPALPALRALWSPCTHLSLFHFPGLGKGVPGRPACPMCPPGQGEATSSL